MAEPDDLHRPLGQSAPQPETAEGRRRFSPVAMLAVAGFALGLGAVALAVTDRLAPPAVEPGRPVAGTVEETPVEPMPGSGGAAGEAVDEDTALPGEADGGETGLTELVPDGRIAIPVPRPERAAPQERGLAHLPDPELLEEGPAGPLPVRSPDGRRPMDVYARQPDTSGNFGVARVVLIIGGLGISQTSSQQAINTLPPSVTLAFAPYGNSLVRWMQAARKDGHELLLQIPMEPFGYPQNTPGRNTATVSELSSGDFSSLYWAMSRLTNYVGVMNYQGGRLLSEPEALKGMFDDLAERGLLFVDDGTANGSLSESVAKSSLLPHARVTLQLDTLRTRQAIGERLAELEAQAKRTGLAIGMGNAFGETIEMVAAFAREAGRRGIEITPVSAIVSDPEQGR